MSKLWKEVLGPFSKQDLIKLQNEINSAFNTCSETGDLSTFAVRTIYLNGKYKDSWCNIPKKSPEKIKGIIIWKVKQNIKTYNNESIQCTKSN